MRHLSNRKAAWLVLALPALFMALALLVVASTGAGAAAAEGPTGEEIVEKFIEATGGKKAYDKLENRKTVAVMNVPSQGMTFNITAWTTREGNVRSIIENAMIGKMEKGVSGDVVWEKSIMTGPVIKEGAERESALREAVFERFVYWKKAFETCELAGEEEVGGVPCWKVVMAPVEGEAVTLYYEKESGLIGKVTTVAETEMGAIPVEAYFKDYKEVDGVMLSHKTSIMILGQERTFTTTSTEHNVEIPDGFFDLPEDIKALQE